MASIRVKVSHGHNFHRFTLLQTDADADPPTFHQLCEALVHHLKLPVSADHIADPSSSLNVWFLDDEKDYVRLFDDISLHEALRLSPNLLRLRLRHRHPRRTHHHTSSRSKHVHSSSPHPPSTTPPSTTPPPAYRSSPSTLLLLVSHLHRHASSNITASLNQLQQELLRHPGDAANLAEARHRFAALFSSFVSEIYTSSHHRLSRTTVLPVLEQLDAIAREAQISQPTVHAAQNAIRIICACPNAVHLIRQKWSSILREKVGNFAPSTVAPPSIRASKSSKALSERPVNHYILHFNRLLNVGSDKVFSHFQRLASISERVKPFSTAQPGLSKELCYALEKVVFHVVIVHKKHRRYSIESHAIRSLRGSVNRKMERAGFQNSKFLHRLSKLVVVMASDPAIIKVVYSWARKRSDRSPANDGDSGELAQHTERIQEEDSETSSESESEGSKSHSRKSPSVRSGSRGRSTSQSGSRSKHGSHSRSHSRGRSGSKNRSQSHSRSRGAGSRSRSRSLSRSRAGSHHSHQNDQENDSNLSLQSLEDAAESARDLEVAEYSQNSSIRGSQCDRYEDYDKVNRWKSSPVQSSDELDRTRRHLNSHDSFSDDSGKSDETNLSQWARVELDNERQSAHRLPYGRGRRSRILQHLPLGISPYSMGGEAQLDEHEHALQNGAGRPLSRKLQNTKNSLVNGANYIRGVLKDHIRDHARSDDSEVTDERMKLSREGARYGVDRPSYRSRIRSRSPFPRSGSGSRAGSRQPHVVDSG